MKKNILLPVILYLLGYLAVLGLCGFFQYITTCERDFSICFINTSSINTIITTTSYVLAPMMVIIGFQSWRSQDKHKKQQEILELILDRTKELHQAWHMSREHNDNSVFQAYRMRKLIPMTLNKSVIADVENKLNNTFNILIDLEYLLTRFYVNSNLNLIKIEQALESIRLVLKENIGDFYSFKAHAFFPDNDDAEIEEKMIIICDKLDRYCNTIMPFKSKSKRKNYSDEINILIERIIHSVKDLKDKI